MPTTTLKAVAGYPGVGRARNQPGRVTCRGLHKQWNSNITLSFRSGPSSATHPADYTSCRGISEPQSLFDDLKRPSSCRHIGMKTTVNPIVARLDHLSRASLRYTDTDRESVID